LLVSTLLLLVPLGACSGGGGGGGGPTTPAAPTISLSISPSAIGINSFADITVRVLSSAGAAMPGENVSLATTLGDLVRTSLVTGSDGSAATQMRGDGGIGTATVTARLLSTGASAQQTVRIGQGTRITLRAAPDSIGGNGTAEIFGIVTHLDGTQTPAGVPVALTTTLGRLSDAHPNTDGTGSVHVQLEGDGRAGTAVVTATTADAVETARLEIRIASASALELQAVPIAIPRDGRSLLIATVRDSEGRLASGVTVRFSTTRGVLDGSNPQSNNLGQAVTNLLAQNEVGRARVTAETNTGTRTVDVDLGQGLTLTLRADPPSIGLNGATTVTLLATTADLRSVPIGTEVVFTTTLGVLAVDHAIVAETGLATTLLRGTGQRGSAKITARVVGFSEQATITVPIQ